MKRILELLARFGELNAEELSELNGLIASQINDDNRDEFAQAIVDNVSADDLEAVATALRARADELLDGETSDATNRELGAIAESLKTIGGMQAVIDSVDENRAAERQRLADEIAAMTGDGEDGDDGEGDEGDEGEEPADGADGGDGADDGEDGGAGGEDGGEGGEGGEGAGSGAGTTPQPVAAGAGTPLPTVRLSNVNARRDGTRQPQRTDDDGPTVRTVLVAAGSYAGIEPGTVLDPNTDEGLTRIGEMMSEAFKAGRGYKGANTNMPVLRLGVEYPEERMLDGDARSNTRKVEAVTGKRGMTAAGGINRPINVRYDMPVIGSTARPVRDALTSFGAQTEGSVSTLPPPMLGDAVGAVTTWTEANDRAAHPDVDTADPATKACLRITSPTAEPTLVDAIVTCFEFGEFDYRYFRQNVDAWLRLGMVESARIAENKLLAAIATGSFDVDIAELLGTTRDVIAGLERMHSVYTYRHRDPNIPFTLIAPIWLRNNMMADLVRQMPVGTLDETFAVGEAKLNQWLSRHNITPHWHLDGEAGQGFATQGDGALQGWPSTAITYFFPTGDWLFLDGGQNDLGVVRDSTLNSVNDLQMFSEFFENAHHHGHESWRATFDVVPDGTASALATVDIAESGS